MAKISTDFIISQYTSAIESYTDFTTEVGLWESEKYVFEKYLEKDFRILDIGCGTGRTTFPLFALGYEKIRGIDLTPDMIRKAKELNQHFETDISFETGDATDLHFKDQQFDAAIFSFNGMMSIPGRQNRLKAICEIGRILKPEGFFIFTTHDRDGDPEFFDFWKEEKQKWDEGRQNPALFEFGDLITTSRNETGDIFIHIPDQEEITTLMENNGFRILETFYRADRFEEAPQVKEKSGECRFWITRKSE